MVELYFSRQKMPHNLQYEVLTVKAVVGSVKTYLQK